MLARLACGILVALGLAVIAVGCGSNDRPFVFGGNPQQSPGQTVAPATS